jgi:Zn-dependent peptidase ImmA (M78 family)
MAAGQVRRDLAVGTGPIPNVVRLLEAHGVLVVRLAAKGFHPRVDAFSSSETASGRPIVLMSPLKDDKARSRFDASHELGHLVMHAGVEPGSRVIESQAMSFAAEFLMPRAEIVDSLPTRVDWGPSMQSSGTGGQSCRPRLSRTSSDGCRTCRTVVPTSN